MQMRTSQLAFAAIVLTNFIYGYGINRITETIIALNLTANEAQEILKLDGLYRAVAQHSLAFYYDYFAKRDEVTNTAAVPIGVETVFGGNYGNEPSIIPGATTSIRMKPQATCTTAAECLTYDNAIAALNSFTYLHIDEVSYNQPCPECADIIQQVGDTPGYAGRIIVFFRFSTSGVGLSDQTRIIDLAMNNYVRKIFFEVYPGTHNDCASYICNSTCDSACSKLLAWNNDIAGVYQGSNIVFSPAFGLRSGVELDICNADLDAITSYFGCMHQYQPDWKGAAFFGASECTGCSSYSPLDTATHCGDLLSWWNGKRR